ncbi:MAG: AmmeMemoRadiSam system protein A [Spirochaetaceae bacterium]|nr:AmmeMemoRadiSam system protein A [Spirochaetaceae bacterium]
MTSPRDRETLIFIARSAIEAELDGQKLEITAYPEGSGGVFVTLKIEGKLRGCIGHLQSEDPIYKTVAKMAHSAAFSDPRFPPLSRNEFDSISIEISRLSEFFPIAAEDVVVGTHGLLLSLGYHSGHLLPQVPGEQGWDQAAFLSGLCRKSGIPEGSWKDPDANLEAFTAEVFGEE